MKKSLTAVVLLALVLFSPPVVLSAPVGTPLPVSPAPFGAAPDVQGKFPALAFGQVTEPREGAFTMLVPKGWLIMGGVYRVDPNRAGGPGNSVAAKNDFALLKDQRGTVMLRYLPDVNYAYGPAVIFPPGANYNGMLVVPLMDAAGFLQSTFRNLRPGAANVRVLSLKRLPETIEAYRLAVAPLNQSLMAIGMQPVNVDAARMVVEYDEGGVHFREELAGGVVDMTRSGGQWSNSRTYALRAPAAEFDAWRRALAIAHHSLAINPRWLAGELRGQNYRAQEVLKVMHEIQRIEAEITANRARTNSAIMHDNYLMLTGQEDYVNPHTGQVERDTNEYRYRWTTPGGDRLYTDDPNLDPGRFSQPADWRRSTIRPR